MTTIKDDPGAGESTPSASRGTKRVRVDEVKPKTDEKPDIKPYIKKIKLDSDIPSAPPTAGSSSAQREPPGQEQADEELMKFMTIGTARVANGMYPVKIEGGRKRKSLWEREQGAGREAGGSAEEEEEGGEEGGDGSEEEEQATQGPRYFHQPMSPPTESLAVLKQPAAATSIVQPLNEPAPVAPAEDEIDPRAADDDQPERSTGDQQPEQPSDEPQVAGTDAVASQVEVNGIQEDDPMLGEEDALEHIDDRPVTTPTDPLSLSINAGTYLQINDSRYAREERSVLRGSCTTPAIPSRASSSVLPDPSGPNHTALPWASTSTDPHPRTDTSSSRSNITRAPPILSRANRSTLRVASAPAQTGNIPTVENDNPRTLPLRAYDYHPNRALLETAATPVFPGTSASSTASVSTVGPSSPSASQSTAASSINSIVSSVTVRPGTISRISMEKKHLVNPRVVQLLQQGRAIQMVDFLEASGKAQICHAGWASEVSGGWRLDTENAPLAMKILPLESLEKVLHEYEMGAKASTAVKRQFGAEVVVEPTIAGSLEIWGKDTGWVSTAWAAVVMPLHEPLYTYIDTHITSLASVGLIFVDALKCLHQLHKTAFFHGDAKADNVVVQQTWKDGTATSTHHALFIDFGTSWSTQPGHFRRSSNGTGGFMSMDVLSAYVRSKFEPKKEDYRKLWGCADGPAALDFFLSESSPSLRAQDDVFGIGVSLLDALVAHKRKSQNITETYRLTSDRQIKVLEEFFEKPTLGPWNELYNALNYISTSYRKIWEEKAYELWLGEEYSLFFPALAYCLQKTTWNMFEGAIDRKPALDTTTFPTLKAKLLAMQTREQDTAKVQLSLDKPKSDDPQSGKAPVKKLSSKTITYQPPKARYNSSTSAYTSSQQGTQPARYPTAPAGPFSIPVAITTQPIDYRDIHLLQQGNNEPFRFGRVWVSKVSHANTTRSWDPPIGTCITTAKGNKLVIQTDGGYLQEVWMRAGKSGEVMIDPDLYGCGSLTFVCGIEGCRVSEEKPVFIAQDKYIGHYVTNRPRFRCPGVLGWKGVELNEVNKRGWHR